MKHLFLVIFLSGFTLAMVAGQGRVYQKPFVASSELKQQWIDACSDAGFDRIVVVTSINDENPKNISTNSDNYSAQHIKYGTLRSALAIGGYIVFDIPEINRKNVNGNNVFEIVLQDEISVKARIFIDGSNGTISQNSDPIVWIVCGMFGVTSTYGMEFKYIGFKNIASYALKSESTRENLQSLIIEQCVFVNESSFSTSVLGIGTAINVSNKFSIKNSFIGSSRNDNNKFYLGKLSLGIDFMAVKHPSVSLASINNEPNATISNLSISNSAVGINISESKVNFGAVGKIEINQLHFFNNGINISSPIVNNSKSIYGVGKDECFKLAGTISVSDIVSDNGFTIDKIYLYKVVGNDYRYVGTGKVIKTDASSSSFILYYKGFAKVPISNFFYDWEYLPKKGEIIDKSSSYVISSTYGMRGLTKFTVPSSIISITDAEDIVFVKKNKFCPRDIPIILRGAEANMPFSGAGVSYVNNISAVNEESGEIAFGGKLSGYIFDPAVAGPGTHTITYSCGTSIVLTVRPVPVISITEQLKTSCHANNGKVIIELSGQPAVTRSNVLVKMQAPGGDGMTRELLPEGSGNRYVYDGLGQGDYKFSAQYVSSNGEPACAAVDVLTISQELPYLSNVTNADLSSNGNGTMCPAEVGGGFNYGPTGEKLSFIIRNNNVPNPGSNKATYSVRYTDELGKLINTPPQEVDYNATITLNYNTPGTYAIRVGAEYCRPIFNEPKLELKQIVITPQLYKNLRYNSSSLFRYSDPVGQYTKVAIDDQSIFRPIITVRRSQCQNGKLILRLESLADPFNKALYNSGNKVYAIMEQKQLDNWVTVASGTMKDGKISVNGSYPSNDLLDAPIEFSFSTGKGSDAIKAGEYRILHAVERYGCSKPFYFTIVDEKEPVKVVFDVRHVRCKGGTGSIVPIVTGGDEDLGSFVATRIGTINASGVSQPITGEAPASSLTDLVPGNYELQSSCRKYLVRILDYDQKSLLYPQLGNDEQREVRALDEDEQLSTGKNYEEEPAPRQPSEVRYTNVPPLPAPSCDNPATLEVKGDYAPYVIDWKEWKGTPLITADENKLEVYLIHSPMSAEAQASGKWGQPIFTNGAYKYTRKKTVYTQGDKVFAWETSYNQELRATEAVDGVYKATFQPNKPGLYTATVMDGCGVAFNMDNTLSSSLNITNFKEITKVRDISPASLIYKGFVIPFPKHDFNLCYAWKNGSDDVPQDPTLVEPSQSNEELYASQASFAISEYAAKCAARKENIGKQFGFNCLNINSIKDQLTVSYPQPTHHHTLYFYDRAGRLVRTVAPEGVGLRGFAVATEKVNHTFATVYTYNNLGQMLSKQSPDAYLSRQLHDSKGRMRYSQDARQRKGQPGRYTYTLYDALSRVVEGGEAELGQGETFETLDPENPASPAGKLLRHTRTHYHEPSPYATYLGKPQRYLDNRVGYSETFAEDGTLESYSAYSYDPHGNVEWLANEIPAIGLHTIGYSYDLLSNKVKEVVYDEGMEGQLYHRYVYDEDQRLTMCRTSRDGNLWVDEALYGYEKHGPLGEVILGHGGLQRLRHTYTIQGWLKAINMQEAPEYAGGKWLPKGSDDSYAQPVYAMALGYYPGDFNRSFMANTSPLNNMVPVSKPLYNGNIAGWMQGYRASSLSGTSAETYTYDRLNRIMDSRWSAMTMADGVGKYVFGDKYSTDYSYDGNGNIKTLFRRQGDGLKMDVLSYNYESGTNRLRMVADGINTTGQGYEDLQDGQLDGNYGYDASGNLVRDSQAKQTITWNAQGKVSKVVPDVPSENSPTLYFRYDGMGQRIEKRIDRNNAGGTNPEMVSMEYYVRDATGNVMAVYRRKHVAVSGGYEAILEMGEQPLYGSSRLGVLRTGQQLGKVAFATGEIESVRFNLVPPTDISTLKSWALTEATSTVKLFNYSQAAGYVLDREDKTLGILSGKIAVDATGGVYSYIIPREESVKIGVRNYGGQEYPILRTRRYALVYNSSLGIDPSRIGSDLDEGSSAVWVGGMVVGASNGNLSFTPANANVKIVEPGIDWFAFSGEMAVSEDRINGRNYVYAQKNKLTEDIKGLVRIDAGSLSQTLLAEVPSVDFDCRGMIDLNPIGNSLAWVNGTPALENIQDIEILLLSLPNGEISRKILLGSMDIRTVSIAFSHNGGELWTSGIGQDGNYVAKVFNLKNGTDRILSGAAGAVQRGADGKMYVGNKINGISLVAGLPLLTSVNVAPRIFIGYQAPQEGTADRTLNQREYEINDHLGNVKVVITDYNTKNGAGVFESPVLAAFDYYAFGMQMPGRHHHGQSGYRYGYNGMEKDNDIKGLGNSYTTLHRFYDSRLGKWLSVDPEAEENVSQSPYCGMDNNPISVIDPDGDDGWDVVNGLVIGTLTNLLPAGGVFRDLYTASSSEDYNNALRTTDNAFMVAGVVGIATGGTMEAGGGSVALAGAVMTATGVGASAGVPTMVAGGTTAGTGALIGAGGAYLLANSANNAKQGYNRGKTQPKQQTTKEQNIKESAEKGIPQKQLGPSGKPKINTASKPTLKTAKDAARNNPKSNSNPLKHSSDKGQKTHFHSTKNGEKLSGKNNTHYENRSSKKNPR